MKANLGGAVLTWAKSVFLRFGRSPENDAPEYRPGFLPFLLTRLFCWIHQPGLNRRPTDYETTQYSQILDKKGTGTGCSATKRHRGGT